MAPAFIWHVGDAVPHALPLGNYRIRLTVSANEAPPIEQWFQVEMNRGKNSQSLLITREA
jgi:hypothetical protein